MAFTEDLDIFFADFGVVGTLAPGGGTLTLILDNPTVPQLDDLVEGGGPRATAKSSEVEALAIDIGSSLSIAGNSFTVRGVEPDGTGVTVLLLRRT